MIEAGDVVEALHDMWAVRPPTPVNKGFRTVVVDITPAGRCNHCYQTGPGLKLADLPLAPDRAWCVNHWRKIGGRDESVRKFAEDLNVSVPLLDHETVIGQTSQDLLQTTLTRCDNMSH